MIKFTKLKDESNDFDESNVTFEIPNNDLSIPDILEEFEKFLKACGYVFEGYLDLVDY
jgi:hypothetical protein